MKSRFDRTSSHDRVNVRILLPYLWEYRGRVLLALSCLMIAKIASVSVPLVLKQIVDNLDVRHLSAVGIPFTLLISYGGFQIANSLFNELRDAIFARVSCRAMRRLTINTLAHLHNLSIQFHLERQTGAIIQDLERGSQALSSLLNYLVFSILPVGIELLLIVGVMVNKFDIIFTLILLSTFIIYMTFTLVMSNWHIQSRYVMSNLDSKAHSEAVDSLINYETVKLFGNENLEVRRCDAILKQWEDATVLARITMFILSFGQGTIIALSITAIMFFATNQVLANKMTLGDLLMVNTFLLQLFIPLGFLGIIYRVMKYSLIDMDRLVKTLKERPEIQDRPNAPDLVAKQGEVRFEQVNFSYDKDRPFLFDMSFTIPPGYKLAVVGPSGAGKSTLARLLLRLYDVDQGRILIDDQDIRDVTQKSVRAAIGVVTQEINLFNNTIYYNLVYGCPKAQYNEVIETAKFVHLHEFISSLSAGYDTVVGERGLKLSGGEKQRIAIARAILKRPKILIFDEATSALDSQIEQAILKNLQGPNRYTTLVIAHRLSTIVDAHHILVIDQGCIVEQGSHRELLKQQGLYAKLWNYQKRELEVERE